MFGNLTSIKDDTWMLKYASILRGYMIRTKIGDTQVLSNMLDERLFYNNIPKVKKFSLFGISRNNVSESAAHAAGISGVQYSCPPNAITLWLEYAHNNVSKFIKGIVSIDVDNVPYTSIGMKFWCMINTCAIDSILFIFHNIHFHNNIGKEVNIDTDSPIYISFNSLV